MYLTHKTLNLIITFLTIALCSVNCENVQFKLSKWFQTVARNEVINFCKKQKTNVNELAVLEPFLQNVPCSDEPNISDNFYFEHGGFTKDGNFFGSGTLYLFDRLEGSQ